MPVSPALVGDEKFCYSSAPPTHTQLHGSDSEGSEGVDEKRETLHTLPPAADEHNASSSAARQYRIQFFKNLQSISVGV